MKRLSTNSNGFSMTEVLATLVIGSILAFVVLSLIAAVYKKKANLEISHAVEDDRRIVRTTLEGMLQKAAKNRIWLNEPILKAFGIDPLTTPIDRTHHGAGLILTDSGVKGGASASDPGTMTLSGYDSFFLFGIDPRYKTYEVIRNPADPKDYYLFSETATTGTLRIKEVGGNTQGLAPGDFVGILGMGGTMVARVSSIAGGGGGYNLVFDVSGLCCFDVAGKVRNIPVPSVPVGAFVYKLGAWSVGADDSNQLLTIGALDLEGSSFYRSVLFQEYNLTKFKLGTGLNFTQPETFFEPGKRSVRLEIGFDAQSLQTALPVRFFMAL